MDSLTDSMNEMSIGQSSELRDSASEEPRSSASVEFSCSGTCNKKITGENYI